MSLPPPAGAHPDLSVSPLSWVKREIDVSIGIVRENLPLSTGRAGSAQALATCVTHLSQVRGALQMLGFDGVTRFCELLERVVKGFHNDGAVAHKTAIAVVDRSVFALSQFLDELSESGLNVPLRLFPVYKELGELQGRHDLTERDLFFPDTRPAVPAHPAPRELYGEELARFVGVNRALYQRGLLGWLKASSNRDGLNAMHRAMDGLRQVAAQLPGTQPLWWTATAFIEALTQTKPAWTAQFKPLVSRIDRYIRDWMEGRWPDPEPLHRDLLYALARAEPVTKRIREVKALYQLDSLLPEYALDGTLEFDLPKLQPVLDDMKERLTALEDSWARYTSGEPHTLTVFRERAVAFKAIPKDLGAYHICNLLDVVVLIAAKLPDPYPPQRETLMLEMSAAFLLIERMLDTFTSLPADIGQQVSVMVGWLLDAMRPRGKDRQAPPALRDDITQRTNLRLLHAQVAREIISNLQQTEQIIDAVSRAPSKPANLASAQAFIAQVRGALDILRLHRANEVLSLCDELIKRCTRADHPGLAQDIEWLAEGLSCLGFYMDEMARGQSATEEVLDFFRERYERRPTLAVVAKVEQLLPVEPAPAPQVETAPPAAAPPSARAADSAVEAAQERAELLAVYVEEAQAVLAAIEESLARLQAAPDDVDALTVIRRGFHTLKGSGRMVGLTDLGELAWEIEQTMNRWLREIMPATPGLIELITQGRQLFAASVDELGRNAPLTLEHRDGVMALARRLASGVEPAMVAAPEATQPPGEVVFGSVRLSTTLFDIYRKEATTHLATLASEFAAWRGGQAPAISHEFIRAAHTLSSSSRTTGLTVIAEFAYALEQWLQHLTGLPGRPASAAIDATGAAIAALERMVKDVEAKRVPQRAAAEITALQSLLAESQARSVVVPMQPIALPAELRAREPAAEYPSVTTALPAATPRVTPVVDDDLDAQLLPTFLDEAGELLPQIGSDLRAWRAEPNEVRLARSLARALHTLKGSARIAGAIRLGELAHAMESRLAGAIESRNPQPALFEAIESDMDRLSESIDRLRAAFAPPTPESAAAAAIETEHLQLTSSLRIDADRVDRMVNEAGEVSIARTRIEGEMTTLKQSLLELTDSVARLRAQVRETQIQADSRMQSRMSELAEEDRQFDPLEFDRYTRPQELARMMVESLHDISLVQQTLLANLKETEAALVQQARVARDLQNELLQLRSVPFSALAERLYRTVRQTAKELGKHATLEIRGGDIEIDRGVLQRMGAPVEHMLRNAIAHGIESPQERVAAGKAESGQLAIHVRQESSEIAVELADDGAGLNFNAIRLEAIRKGLLAPSEEIAEAALGRMIFAPGFSTARDVTETAGRGVGMDVVRMEVAALGGRVDVASQTGRGTTFSLYLPQSLAVAQAVVVRAGGQTYAIPSPLVEQVQTLKPDQLSTLYRNGVLEWEDASYRFLYLPLLLGQSGQVADIKPYNSVLLLKSGANRIAVHVDELVRNQEIVNKNAGPQLARVSGISGATVLGNGQVVLIINPVQLALRANLSSVQASVTPTRMIADEAPAPLVMVVDDSLTVRQFSGRLLKRAGYQVATAKDGVDALQQMQETLPDLMLLDIEMPRMDGFELTKIMRGDPRLAAIPIIIVTSRTADKHRAHALELGANGFFGKPYAEDELLRSVAELLVTANR
jgi:chemosensory pili system protein ChpA (sensor histidine kinase/response regulator)